MTDDRETPDLAELLKVDDPAFDAWVKSLPAKHWSKYDLSALKLGWNAARLPTAGVAMTNPTIPENGLDANERGWRYNINYGPDGEEDYANLVTPEGQHVANIRTHFARRIVERLNVARRLPPADNAVAVKALEWGQEHSKVYRYSAPSVAGKYYVTLRESGYVVERRDDDYLHTIGAFETADLARAAAQADYETRIRSALEPTPSYAEGRAAGLREEFGDPSTMTYDLAGLIAEMGSEVEDAESGGLAETANLYRAVIEALEALIGAAS